jgi:hypothetical protein
MLSEVWGMEPATILKHPIFGQAEHRPARSSAGGTRIPTLGEILSLPLNEIPRFSIGFLNLLSATMLPDTLNLDIIACLKQLDLWTQHVKSETERNFHRFRKAPGDYGHSEGRYRAGMMITVLQQDCGVRYDPNCIKTKLFLDSREGFIHGLLTGKGGTCANMPILYAAIGRNLGYPIYICSAKAHLFCRWATKDGRERFNIEGSGHGMGTPDDEHYKKWPHEISEKEVYLGHFLRNLDPFEELAEFMAVRGHCFLDRAHFLDAIVAYSHAHRLAPTNPHHFSFLMGAMNVEIIQRQEGKLPGSYREAEIFCQKKNSLARFVLDDNYPRLDKSRQPQKPIAPVNPKL